MKEKIAIFVLTLCATVIIGKLTAQQPQKLTKLTQISEREFINLEEVISVRLPVFNPDEPSCTPNCQRRWGAQILFKGGGELLFTDKADDSVAVLVGGKIIGR